MIDFITKLFQSEDEKLAEQYEKYKREFNNMELLKKGNTYWVKQKIKHPRYKGKLIETNLELKGYSEIEAKASFVLRCREYEQNQKTFESV